jgi:hypothetical protein
VIIAGGRAMIPTTVVMRVGRQLLPENLPFPEFTAVIGRKDGTPVCRVLDAAFSIGGNHERETDND